MRRAFDVAHGYLGLRVVHDEGEGGAASAGGKGRAATTGGGSDRPPQLELESASSSKRAFAPGKCVVSVVSVASVASVAHLKHSVASVA